MTKEIELSTVKIEGATLWDFYAAHAIYSNILLNKHRPIKLENVVGDAANIADAMLEERKKRFE